jgi:prepilin-type N-terminal cleavage/methylation domain-containing protein
MMESNKHILPSSYSPVGASIPVCPDVNMEAVLTSIGPSLRARVFRYPVACKTKTNQRQRGFSIVELLIVVVVALILSAMAIPSVVSITRSARNNADARGISAALNLARMRAAADFTHTRIYMNLTGNTYHLELWNKASACVGLRRHFRIRFDIRGTHGGYQFDRSGAALHGWRRGRKPRCYHRQYRVYRI